MYLLLKAMQEMGQMLKQAEIADKTSKKKLSLENPLQSGTWSKLLQKLVLGLIDLPWEGRAWSVPIS